MADGNNFVLLEHVNLNVTDRDVAVAFYEQGLGLTINPKGVSKSLTGEWRQVHFNAGLSQFHCAWLDGDGSRLRQNIFSGSITLNVTSLSDCKQSLNNISNNSKINIKVELGEDEIKVTGPYGNTFFVKEAPTSHLLHLKNTGEHPGGVGSCIGISKVVHTVGKGCAEGIARFYNEVIGAETEVRGGEVGGLKECVVCAGSGPLRQELVFQESLVAEARDAYDTLAFKDFHIAIYVRDLEAAFRKCAKLGLVWINPRYEGFPLFDKVDTLDKAKESSQFRIKKIVDPSTYEEMLFFEHEIRDLSHQSCPLNDGKHRKLGRDAPSFDNIASSKL